ncbi:MAG: hypothetical protein WA734_07445 [Candidatus Acidiferrales bacterium]
MLLNYEQRQAILARIGDLEDDVYRCKMELGRGGQSASEKTSLADRIARAENRIVKLKEDL